MKEAAKYNFRSPARLQSPGQRGDSASSFKKDNNQLWKEKNAEKKAQQSTSETKDVSTNTANKPEIDMSKATSGQKRKYQDDDPSTNKSPSKRAKTTATAFVAAGYGPYPTQPAHVYRGTNRADGGWIPVAQTALQYEQVKESFNKVNAISVGEATGFKPQPVARSDTSLVTSHVPNNAEIAKESASSTKPAAPLRKIRKPTHNYNLRSKDLKRALPTPAADETSAGPAHKRARLDKDVEDGEVTQATTTSVNEIVKQTKKKSKHRPHSRKKAKTQVVLDMPITDLFPHYTPDPAQLVRDKEKQLAKKPPVTFMDLPTEMRRHIWSKVFEDESYHFKLKKHCSRDSYKQMIPHTPKSFGCLFINKTCAAEVRQEMYKSVKLEIEFARLRPAAMREFVAKLTQHRIGKEAERIFFIKKFGLQKVNLGSFAKAREIVSTHWTVEGDGKMDEDDYKNNRIDPAHILVHPPSKDKLKGLKERRLWKDQEAAAQRYQRHLDGWCHPLSKDPKAENWDEAADRKPCPFDDHCLKLKETKFVIVVKYKFGCIKGRHARHKEALYDLYPLLDEKLVQTGPPKSKFHKKCNKKGCKDLDGEQGS